MAQPPEYVRQYDFSAFQALNPTTPLPAAQIDLEFNEVKDTLDVLNANIALIQRDDGALRNLSVGLDQLKPEVVLGVPTDWVTATAYERHDVVWNSGVLYVCNTDHTSGVFATDLAAVKWTAYLDYADPLADAAGYAATALGYSNDAAASATAADVSEAAAAASAVAAAASAVSAAAAIAAIAIPWTVAQGGTGGTTQATARSGIGISSAMDAVVVAATLSAGRAALGATTVGDALFIAASAAAGRTALGLGDASLATIGTSGDTVPKNNAANTFSAAQAISITAAGAALTLTSTDPGATSGPNIILDRNSASPAAADVLAGFFFRGRSSTAVSRDYASIYPTITDATNASEDAYLSFTALVNGTDTEGLRVSGTQAMTGDGTVGAPAQSFYAHPNYGLYYTAGDVAFAANGVLSGAYNTARWQFTLPAYGANGSAAAPTWSFINDTTMGAYRIGALNYGISVNSSPRLDIDTSRVLVAGGNDLVLGAALISPTSVYSVGYRGVPTTTQNAAYGFVLSDAGSAIYHDEVTARTYTIPANSSVAYPIGTVIVIDNTGNAGAAGSITLSITTDTLRRGDGVAGTGSRTIAASSVAAIRKSKSTEWVITGAFT